VIDQGYTSAQLLLSSQKDYDIELYGPVSEGSGWQAQTDGAFDLSCFQIDWSKQQVRCPQKKVSRSWKAGQDSYGNPVIHVQFSGRDCTPCKARSRCTKSKRAPRDSPRMLDPVVVKGGLPVQQGAIPTAVELRRHQWSYTTANRLLI
jgi:transposase